MGTAPRPPLPRSTARLQQSGGPTGVTSPREAFPKCCSPADHRQTDRQQYAEAQDRCPLCIQSTNL